MRKYLFIALLAWQGISLGNDDAREYVEMPPMMREHMLGNMRDHLLTINTIINAGSQGEWDKAADLAEQRLGLSSLDDHGAKHMGKVMPKGMREAGQRMHHAATAFALKAQEGDADAAWQALGKVTGACVACHAGYRIH